MRILHLGTEMAFRGGENQIRLLIEGLNHYPDIQNFIVYPNGSAAVERFRELGTTCTMASRSPLDPRNSWQLKKICKKHQIDIIVAHSSVALGFALSVKKNISKLKLVFHRRVDVPLKKNIFSRRKLLNPYIDAYVCISQAIADRLKAQGVSHTKLHVVRSAVDESPYKNTNKEMNRHNLLNSVNSPDKLIFGHASALTAEKGLLEIINACHLLQKKGFDFLCIIAGKGPLSEILQNQIVNFNLQNQVKLVGHIKEISSFLLGVDVLLLPSYSEGLGTVLLEAAYAGCALIGSQVGGIPEVIVNNKTGLLVQPKNIEDLALAMETMMTNISLRQSLAAEATTWVRKEFSLSTMVEGNLQVYRNIMRQKDDRS